MEKRKLVSDSLNKSPFFRAISLKDATCLGSILRTFVHLGETIIFLITSFKGKLLFLCHLESNEITPSLIVLIFVFPHADVQIFEFQKL